MEEVTPAPGGAGEPGRAPHVVVLPSWYPTALEPVGGIFFREQAQALVRHGGVRVGVIAPVLRPVRSVTRGGAAGYRFQVEEEDDQGVRTLRALGWNAPRLPALNRRVWLWLARRMLRRYAARYGAPDLIHAHSVLTAAWPARVLARERGIPCVVTEHTSLYAERRIEPWQAAVLREVFAGAARVIAVSRALARELEPYVGGTPVEVVPNLVDTGFFTPPPRPRGGGRFRFLSVALSDPVKGTDVLLRAFAEGFRGRDAELELGGGGPLEPSFRRLAGEMGIADQVRFLGPLTREGVRDAMWRADAYVLPSLVETFGVVVIEAMATGLPVVATACGGPQDTVVPAAGRLVPPGDAAALAAEMRAMARDHEGWRRASGEIRAHAVKHFSQPVVAARLASLYRAVLEEHAAGR